MPAASLRFSRPPDFRAVDCEAPCFAVARRPAVWLRAGLAAPRLGRLPPLAASSGALLSVMNPEHPPPYPGPGPTAPYPPYPQPAMGPVGGPYPPPQGYPYQGYPQYGWQGGPQEPPKTTVYVVEDQRRDDLGPSTCLTACWTALCCCCLWDMLT
ncbi:cysteine-rich and transmembrane domain-containing protein 1 [Cavia porcellus]|nr:cysteine-rich and transmembrane domain-containing protein 1 [Cavia porcellus]